MQTKKTVVVITGGPSGGKTTLIHTLQKEFGQKLSIVPEAASILYSGGFPRKKSTQGRVRTQRAICLTQAELEEMIQAETGGQVLVCDRGRLDSLAYWPDEAGVDFFASLETTMDKEVARYDWVLHLDTAAAESFDSTNPIRLESHREAQMLNQRLLQAWQAHPQRVIIPHYDDFLTKLAKSRSVIQRIMKGDTLKEIISHLHEVSVSE